MTADSLWITHFNPKQKFTGKEYLPYSLAIGQASIAWNYLHEELGALFMFFASGSFFDGTSVWYSTNFDRPRREMLKAAVISARDAPASEKTETIKPFYSEILWILGQAEKLEDLRNTILHSPIRKFPDAFIDFGLPDGMSADISKGNPRAQRLQKTEDGLRQIRWFRDSTTILGNYSHCIYWELSHGGGPSLGRPKLPNRGQKNSRPSRHRQSPEE